MNTEPNNKSCPKCGSIIPPEAPQGLCPKCVMSGVSSEPGGETPELTAEDIPAIARVAAAFPQLDEFELIGRGGMGIVFKARQPHLDRQIALKLLPDKLAADPQFAERFNREGRVLAKLNHPNIVSVYDFGKTEHFYFLMMEFVDGVNLREAMRAGRFSPAEALAIVPKICEALQYAHDQDVLHRDIKPENILLDTQGRAKIADFGIAKLVGEDAAGNVTLTMTGVSLGTPHYMAPEQLEKPSDVDHRADIYSLGVVLYEMLTGELPIGRFEAPSSTTPVGTGVDEVVFRALEKNRDRRQRSAEEFSTQVQTAKMDKAPIQGSSPANGKPTFSLPAICGASLVGLSFLLLLIGIIILRTRPSFGTYELLLVGIPAGIAALVGTILGWVGLVQIRGSQGAKIGIPLALFAAVAYPFGVPTLLVLAFPFLTLTPANASVGFVARAVIFGLLSGSLSAVGWGGVAVGRWAGNHPRGKCWSMRGWLKTTAALTIALVSLVSLADMGSSSNRSPVPIVSHTPTEARLPDGVIELVALSEHPSDGTWWKPDGSPWTGEIFKNPGRRRDAKANHRAVEMVFKTTGVTGSDPSYKFILAGSAGSSGERVDIKNAESDGKGHFTVAQFPEDLTETTVRVRLAHGEWITLADQETGSQPNLAMVRHGQPISLKFLPAEQNAAGDAVLKVAHDIKHAEVRLMAVDREGNERRSSQSFYSSGELTATFEGTPLNEIARIRLKTRLYQWAVFENIQLEPRKEAAPAGVRVTFDEVSLEAGDVGQRLVFSYTVDSDRVKLGWHTDGRFRNAGADLLESTSVIAGARVDEPAAYRHRASLALASDMEAKDIAKVLQAARKRWQGSSLVIHSGDRHGIAAVKQGPSNEVTLSLLGRPAKDD